MTTKPGMRTSTLTEVFEHPADFNNLIPSPNLAEDLPPGVKFRLMVVNISHDPDDGEIYKSGYRQMVDGGSEKTYSLSKAGLNKILAAANANAVTDSIQDIPGKVDVKQAMVRVLHRNVEGRWREYGGSFDLDIESEVAACRAAKEKEIAEHSKITRKIWQGGRKVDKTYEGKVAMAIVDREVLEFDSRIRKFSGAMVETKAMLRAAKGCFAIRDGYTQRELARPFITYFYQFPPEQHRAAENLWSDRPSANPEEQSGTPTEENGSQSGPPPAKPSIEERGALLRTEGLTKSEMKDLAADVCAKAGMPLPEGIETWGYEPQKGFLLGLIFPKG
jgi:hypothetical protein